MRELSPEEKKALITQALTKKMGSDPNQMLMDRYPQLAKAPLPAALSNPGFEVGGPSLTARGFAPSIPPQEEISPIPPIEDPSLPPAPPIPAAPRPPMRTMPDAEPAAFAEPESMTPPPEEPNAPMQLPTDEDVVGQYTPEGREELRSSLEKKSMLGLLPGIMSMFGDAQANASGIGSPINGTGNIINGVNDAGARDIADFDTGRKQKIEDYLTGIKAREAGRAEAVENDNTDASTALSNAKRKTLKSLGYTDDLSKLSGAQMDPIIKSYLTKYTADQDADSKRMTREALGLERESKKEEKLKGLVVPGWELTGEVLPDDTEAKKARDGQANYEAFKSDLVNLKDLVEKYGTVELTGPESAEMEALVKSLQLNLKNIAQLGVLSASDIPFLTKQVPDINTMKALFTSSGTFKAGLDQSLSTAESKFTNFMKSRGYVPKGGAPTGAPTDGSSGGKIKVSNGKETLLIDPADAADAQADGYRRL